MSKDIDIEKEDWYGSSHETDVKVDATTADGKPIIIRQFEAKFRPDIDRFPTEKQIAEDHQQAIDGWLWRDELRQISDVRVKINKEEKTYTIFVPCQPKRGANLFHKVKTLAEVIKPGEGK